MDSPPSSSVYISEEDFKNEKLQIIREIGSIKRQIHELKTQLSIKYQSLNDLKIKKAVYEREIKIRRETKLLLPTLESVSRSSEKIRQNILNNITPLDNKDDFSNLSFDTEIFTSTPKRRKCDSE